METLYGAIAVVLMVAAVVAKVSTTRLVELYHVRMRSLERRRSDLQQRLSVLSGEHELARREHTHATQDVQALKGHLRKVGAVLDDLEADAQRTNQRLARNIRAVERPEAEMAAT